MDAEVGPFFFARKESTHLPQVVWPGDVPGFVRSLVASDIAVLAG
jgi:hypothetical protein